MRVDLLENVESLVLSLASVYGVDASSLRTPSDFVSSSMASLSLSCEPAAANTVAFQYAFQGHLHEETHDIADDSR